jgi:hypothetical protein
LQHAPYDLAFAERLGCSIGDAQRHVQALCIELDHHNLGYVLNERTGLGADDCLRRVMSAVAPRHPQMEDLRARVTAMLG